MKEIIAELDQVFNEMSGLFDFYWNFLDDESEQQDMINCEEHFAEVLKKLHQKG